MNAKIYTGTLEGLEGTTVGRFVKFETAHNLQEQFEILREGLRMIEQATSVGEAQSIARDLILGHNHALAIMGTLQ